MSLIVALVFETKEKPDIEAVPEVEDA